MQFNTKFNIKDTVWYLHNDKPTKLTITCISINGSENGLEHWYTARDDRTKAIRYDIFEDQLFATEGELINHYSIGCNHENQWTLT